MSIATLIKEKAGDTPVTKLAADIGISYPTLVKAMDGKSKPNSGTIPKYAKFLGLEPAALAEKLGVKFKEKKAKAGKKMGKRGRKAKKQISSNDNPFDIAKAIYDILKPLADEKRKTVLDMVKSQL